MKRTNALIQACPIDTSGNFHTSGMITREQLKKHIEEDNVRCVFLVYEDPEYLRQFYDLGIEIVPLYRITDHRNPDKEVPMSHPDVKPAGIGEIHPILKGPHHEGFELGLEELRPTLEFANKHGLFVTIHMDDRGDRHRHLKKTGYIISRASYVEEIARAYPNLKIVLNHAGSYSAIGAEFRQRVQGDRYRKSFERKLALVLEALDMVDRSPNVWLETSVLNNPEKTDVIVNGYDPSSGKYPATFAKFSDPLSEELLHKKIPPAPIDRLLMGTDHPIGINSYPKEISLKRQEQYLRDAGMLDADIQRIYDNASRFLKPASNFAPKSIPTFG